MHVHTHVMSGWIAGNLPDLTARERFLCMAAAAAPDLDGLGILVSRDLYEGWHHVLGHNLPFGLVLSLALAVRSARRGRAFLVYLACFHLHLVMDYWGSGADWGIHYFWPFSEGICRSANAWELYSWQNTLAGSLCAAWMLRIIYVTGRTPLEWPCPALDPKVTAAVRSLWGRLGRG